MVSKVEIKYINYGIGNRVGNIIYLNQDMKKYPKLHDAVLKHEKKHSGTFKAKDFLIDLRNTDLGGVRADYYSFLLHYPKSFANFLPIMKLGNCWCYDISLILIWAIAILQTILIIYFVRR